MSKAQINKVHKKDFLGQTSVQTEPCTPLIGTFNPVVWLNNKEDLNFLSVFSDTKVSDSFPLLMSHRFFLVNKENNNYYHENKL